MKNNTNQDLKQAKKDRVMIKKLKNNKQKINYLISRRKT